MILGKTIFCNIVLCKTVFTQRIFTKIENHLNIYFQTFKHGFDILKLWSMLKLDIELEA